LKEQYDRRVAWRGCARSGTEPRSRVSRETCSTRNRTGRGAGQHCGLHFALTLPATAQEAARFGLKNGDEVNASHEGLILSPFVRCKLSLVTFLGQLCNVGSRGGVGTKIDNCPGSGRAKRASKRIEQPIQCRGFCNFHVTSVPSILLPIKAEYEEDKYLAGRIRACRPRDRARSSSLATSIGLWSKRDRYGRVPPYRRLVQFDDARSLYRSMKLFLSPELHYASGIHTPLR